MGKLLMKLDMGLSWILYVPLKAVSWVAGTDTWPLTLMRFLLAPIGLLWLIETFIESREAIGGLGVVLGILASWLNFALTVIGWLGLTILLGLAMVIHEATRQADGDTVQIPPKAMVFFYWRPVFFTWQLLALPSRLQAGRLEVVSSLCMTAFMLSMYAVHFDPPGKSLPQLLRNLVRRGVQLLPSGV